MDFMEMSFKMKFFYYVQLTQSKNRYYESRIPQLGTNSQSKAQNLQVDQKSTVKSPSIGHHVVAKHLPCYGDLITKQSRRPPNAKSWELIWSP